MDQRDYQRRRLVEWLVAEITRTTGRRYSIKLEALDDESLARSSVSSATSTTRSRWPCSRRGSSPGGGDPARTCPNQSSAACSPVRITSTTSSTEVAVIRRSFTYSLS